MKLLTKISIIFILGGFVASFIIGFFSFQLIQNPFSNLIGKEQMLITRDAIDEIDHLIHERYLDIRSIAEEEHIEAMLADYNTIGQKELLNRLGELSYLSGPWDALFLVDIEGKILHSAFSVPRNIKSDSIKDYPHNLIAFKETIQGRPYFSDVIRAKYSQKPTMILSAPVYNDFGPERKIVGAVIGNLSHGVITEVLDKLPGEAHIYNKEGFVIATNQDHQDEILTKNISDNKEINYQLTAGPFSNVSLSVDRKRTSFVSQVVQRGFLDYLGSGWHLVYEVDNYQITAEAYNISRNFTILLVPAVLLMFWMFFVIITRFVVRPIHGLTLVTRDIQLGNLNKRSNINSKDEVGELARSFNRMIDQIQEVDKMKTEFISLASHQLRTPVSTINWHAETLLDGNLGALNAGQKEYLEKVYRNSKRLGRLVGALLDTSKMELGTLNPAYRLTDLKQLATAIFEEYEIKAKEKNIKINLNIDDDVQNILTEPDFLKTIIENLVSNAMKYSKPGGEISIGISKSENSWLIKVADSGYGIPKQEQSKIFTKLFRASNATKYDTDGTGLGLYISKSMTEKMGGRIWFESKEDSGTIFFVSLPIKEPNNVN